MNALNFFGFNKVVRLFTIIKAHGGFKSAFLTFLRVDDLKIGKLVGEDKMGNKYYESNYYCYGKNRWVIYSEKYGFDYDASQISAEWYGWLHYKTDLLPTEVEKTEAKLWPPQTDPDSFSFLKLIPNIWCEDKSRPNYKWMLDHTDNLTGTLEQYVPYSTTRKTIESWVPPKGNK